MPYGVRVAQLLGLAGFLTTGLHWLLVSQQSKLPLLIFGAASLLLWLASTLALRWMKRSLPETVSRAIQSADKRWNTPLSPANENRIQVAFLIFLVLLGIVLLWFLN